MPTIDMPLSKLRDYQGRNPRPQDFDAYWERAIAEMRAVDAEVELVKADFQVPIADCFHLYFSGVRGARIHAKYVRPKIDGPHPAILQYHGYSANSGDWWEKLTFAALGFSVLSMDCRGQGGLSEDKGGVRGNTLQGHLIRGLDDDPDNLLFRHIFLDTVKLAEVAMNLPEVDPDRIGAMGGSQGGGLTIACAALEPRIKRLAPMYPFLSDYLRAWEMDLVVEEVKQYFRRFDPLHEREAEVFERLGYIDIQHLAGRIRGEVLMGVALTDNICPPSTQFAAYNKISAPKKMEIYPDFGHEGLPGFNDKILQFMLGL